MELFCLSSVWVAIVLSVRKLLIHRYMLLCIPASLISMKRPCLQTLSCAFPDQERGRSCLCSFGIHFELLCESNQLAFCGVVTSEARLAWCDDIVVFKPPIQTSVNHPLYQCSDT